MNHGIDFDDARAAWRGNKRRKGESFAYICGFAHPNGRRCGRDAARGTVLDLRNVIAAGEIPLCPQHLALEENRLKKLSLGEATTEKQSSIYNPPK
jgi:hypothetical protein